MDVNKIAKELIDYAVKDTFSGSYYIYEDEIQEKYNTTFSELIIHNFDEILLEDERIAEFEFDPFENAYYFTFWLAYCDNVS